MRGSIWNALSQTKASKMNTERQCFSATGMQVQVQMPCVQSQSQLPCTQSQWVTPVHVKMHSRDSPCSHRNSQIHGREWAMFTGHQLWVLHWRNASLSLSRVSSLYWAIRARTRLTFSAPVKWVVDHPWNSLTGNPIYILVARRHFPKLSRKSPRWSNSCLWLNHTPINIRVCCKM